MLLPVAMTIENGTSDDDDDDDDDDKSDNDYSCNRRDIYPLSLN